MITLDSPNERPIKQILIALTFRNGRSCWALAGARKVGHFYEISEEALEHLLDATGGRPMSQQARSARGLDIDRSLHTRPLKFYREWGAASTISDTGSVPIK